MLVSLKRHKELEGCPGNRRLMVAVHEQPIWQSGRIYRRLFWLCRRNRRLIQLDSIWHDLPHKISNEVVEGSIQKLAGVVGVDQGRDIPLAHVKLGVKIASRK